MNYSYVAVLFSACGSAAAAPPMDARVFATGLAFPLYLTHAPGDAAHVFVVELGGRIRTLNAATGEVSPTVLLDVTPIVRRGGDGGLLCCAFDPGFASNHFLYIYYTSEPTHATLARYTVNPSTLVADPASAFTILRYSRTRIGHNGGWIGFSPADGFLYLSSGDGGVYNNPDPINASQTITNQLQGKMLRIDVHGGDAYPADADRNYAIPASNPFVGIAGDDEIWAYGLRNAWRSSFDAATGDLWMADVGQDTYEEIEVERFGDLPAGGRNYGWRCVEGPQCTGYDGCPCPLTGVTAPYYVYDHVAGQSITGGYVYRGGAIPELVGKYIFSDFQEPKVFVLTPGGGGGGQGAWVEDVSADLEPFPTPYLTNLCSWGEDAMGELYCVDIYSGRVMKIVPQDVAPPPTCYADFNMDGGVDGQDVGAFFVMWEAGDFRADTTEDGGVDGRDVERFIVQWGAGGC